MGYFSLGTHPDELLPAFLKQFVLKIVTNAAVESGIQHTLRSSMHLSAAVGKKAISGQSNVEQ